MSEELDKQKQLTGKERYFNRVDVEACIAPVARVRSAAIDNLKKYPESMQWRDISIVHFVDAIQRHLNAIYAAGDIFAEDPETGCMHIDAIAWNHHVIEVKRLGRERDVL